MINFKASNQMSDLTNFKNDELLKAVKHRNVKKNLYFSSIETKLPKIEYSVQERFYLGDDESDTEDDKKNLNNRFGLSSDSWNCNRSTFLKSSDLDTLSDHEYQSCFLMSSDDEDDNNKNNLKTEKINKEIDDDIGIGSMPHSATEYDELVIDKSNKFVVSFHSVNKVCDNKKLQKSNFYDFYKMEKDHLGSGAYASVSTAISLLNGKEYAVKLVDKREPGHTRSRIFREVGIFKLCKNHPNIVQLIEWFEDDTYFYMVFEKMHGGPLLNHIQRRVCFTEREASLVTRDIAAALKYLHDRGIAHRDVKPENILCVDPNSVSPVKLCDLDLASKPSSFYKKNFASNLSYNNDNDDDDDVDDDYDYDTDDNEENLNNSSVNQLKSYHTFSTPRNLPIAYSEPDLASPVGSAEFMAPEVVDAFVGDSLKYNKRCDMWSLGVIIYIMLCGYPPFYGECERNDCGWNQGETCSDCQENLFHRIQIGEFDFPHDEWHNISDEAKDLICHLLVRNVRERYTADDVLNHSWVAHGAPKTLLQSPSNLFRNDSARDMHQMNQVFQVYQQQFNKTDF